MALRTSGALARPWTVDVWCGVGARAAGVPSRVRRMAAATRSAPMVLRPKGCGKHGQGSEQTK